MNIHAHLTHENAHMSCQLLDITVLKRPFYKTVFTSGPGGPLSPFGPLGPGSPIGPLSFLHLPCGKVHNNEYTEQNVKAIKCVSDAVILFHNTC